jgi:hypothetical protein
MAEKLEKQLTERKQEKRKEKPSQKPKAEKAQKAAPVDTKGITVKKSEDLSEDVPTSSYFCSECD